MPIDQFKALSTLVAIVCFMILLCSGASASESESESESNNGEVKLFEYIENEDFSSALNHLNSLYSAYPNGPEAESQFMLEVDIAGDYLTPEQEQLAEQFINLYPNHVSVKFLEALYVSRKGTKARGSKWSFDTAPKNFNNMKNELYKSIPLFEAVLDEDPENHLAHVFTGVNYSFLNQKSRSNKHYKQALEISPASYNAWTNILWFNHPRWGGNYAVMEELLAEMESQVIANPRLTSLKGLVLTDKADRALRGKKLAESEELIFQALEFGVYGRNRKVLDSLHREIQSSGDRAGACRISTKVNAMYPDNLHYSDLADSC